MLAFYCLCSVASHRLALIENFTQKVLITAKCGFYINAAICNVRIILYRLNIAFGCKYFSNLINKYNGNYYLAICAYNAGMGNVNKWLSDSEYSENGKTLHTIPFGETKRYLEKVEKGMKIYKKLYKEERL